VLEIFLDHVEGSWADAEDFLDAGDRIVVLGRARGRARTTGDEFEVPFAHVWGMADGVPAMCRCYLDTQPVMAALGQPSSETLIGRLSAG
jgi:ketosteroid isomerase-like protein